MMSREETVTTDELVDPQVESDSRPRWERVECTCPDLCERDHELD